jgi:hypothetical protein
MGETLGAYAPALVGEHGAQEDAEHAGQEGGLGQHARAHPAGLPFQGLDTSNHIAQWTETVVPIE